MRKPRCKRQRQAGVTLIELMISLVIVSFAIAATFALGFSLMNGYREHKRMNLVERAARSSMQIVADAIRGASAGLDSGNLIDLVGCSSFGALRVVNASGAAGTDAPDTVEVIHAAGGGLTSVRAKFTDTSTTLTVLDGSELWFDNRGYVILTDFDQGHLIQLNGAPVDQGDGTWNIPVLQQTNSCPGLGPQVFTYEVGALVIRARSSRFYVESGAAVGNVPTLMVDPDADGPLPAEPLAEGIEDMQLAVGVDVNQDGTVADASSTADEWFYNVAGDAPAPAMIPVPPRAVRLTLVARSLGETSQQAIFRRPSVEDRPQGALDVFRRRVLSATIEVRNLRGSP